MHKVVLANAALVLALVGLTGCPNGGNGQDAGPPPDMCNSKAEALTKPECNLPLDGGVSQYIGFAGDVDWFRVELPAGATSQDLIRVRGGYGAEVPQTPVNFAMLVLHDDADGGTASLGRVIDRHGQAPPKQVELVFRAPQPASKPLVVQAADEMLNPALPKFEPRYMYRLFADKLTDLDVHEPNDASPTAIPMTGSTGTITGYLSVPDDVDLYSVAVPASTSPRKILYVHVTAPQRTSPMVPYRLQFTLYDPAGVPVSENWVDAGAQFLPVDLATARVARGGTWLIKVQGYREAGAAGPIPGDLTYPHTVEVAILDEQDANEPDDSLAAAPARTLSTVGSSTQLTGRLEYVGDQDWYRVNVNSSASPTVLHYKLTPNGPGGRFAPIPGDGPDRQLNVMTEVTGYPDRAAATAACESDPAVCPPGYLDDGLFLDTVQGLCRQNDPPRCLEARREEDVTAHPDLRNFEGAIPIPANRAMSFVFSFQSLTLWADDKDYTLDVQWQADPDEAGRTFSGGIEQPRVVTLAEDPNPAANGFPNPFPGATALTGTLSHGHGMVFDPDLLLNGDVIRGGLDYDAVMSDTDKWELTIPPQDPSQPLDRTWELQWEVRKAVDGTAAYDLDVEAVFCDGDQLTGGNCTPVPSTTHGFSFTYSDQAVHSWHNRTGAWQPAWGRTEDAGTTTTTAVAYGCFCFEPRFVKGGKFNINVLALNRSSYAPVTYTLRTAFTSYPQQYQEPNDGGWKSCPPSARPDAGVPDGGEPDAGADAGVPDAGPAWLPGCQFISSPL